MVFCFAATVAANPQNRDPLPSWNDGKSKQSILAFVREVTNVGSPAYVPPAERVAVFDNDGTLWTEKPIPAQLAYLGDRVKARSPQHPEWKDLQPFKAALEDDLGTLAQFGMLELQNLIVVPDAGLTVEEYSAEIREWLLTARHPRFHRLYTECVYQPMLELLNLLRASGFKVFMTSGNGVDFIREFSEPTYGISREDVIGSNVEYEVRPSPQGLELARRAGIGFVNNGEGKPLGIFLHIGIRPIMVAGNSDGDLAMMQFAAAGLHPALTMVLHHDDADREYEYDEGAEEVLKEAAQHGWTVISLKKDFKRVFPEGSLR